MQIKSFLVAGAAVLAFAACQSAPEADTATTTEAQTATAGAGEVYTVDTTTAIHFVGTKLTGKHDGVFTNISGELNVDGNNLTGGKFTIDVNSLNITDLTGEDKGKLEGHLKSPDFFDVAKYPTADFEITGVAAYDSTQGVSQLAGATHTISGNLKMKDSTVNVSFPAVVSIANGQATANAKFSIDRTRWGMNYKGPNNPADFVISKEVVLEVKLNASKK